VGLPGLVLQGVPGEPVGELANALRMRSPVPFALVGLADGYVGYIETPEHALAGAGESERTWYGPALAETLGLLPR
ncbi:MAG: hypothetical protein JST92_18365, partial [Deltaproteobacteria bacterium]|nr:hypothetical protein [Deltaproteobacteria bacterium]